MIDGPLETLLAVQERDAALDRIEHDRATLPERAALARLEGELAALDAELAPVRADVAEQAKREQALDDEAAAHRQRAADIERRLYSGEVSSPRELQAMQSEVAHLRLLQREVEDRELELMEAREGLDARLRALEERRAALVADLDAAQRAVADRVAVLDAAMADERSARDSLARLVPAETLSVYERCRAKANGVGIARLDGLRCTGCHLTIPAVDADAFRRASDGELVFCDNCGCILVAR